MKWNLFGLAGLLTVLVVEMHAAPADACGMKLTIKSSAPRKAKAAARTSIPSDVLLLGTPPPRLQRDLAAAGHRVEVAPNTSAAKRKSYAVVVVDSGMQDEARSKFSGAVVVVRSGDVAADISSVERQVARKPVRADAPRVVVAARSGRTPVAAGPVRDPNRRIVAAKQPAEVQPDPEPAKPAAKVVASAPPVVESKAIAERPIAEPKRVAASASPPTSEQRSRTAAKTTAAKTEVYFTRASAKLGSVKMLDKAMRRLADNPDVEVVIEGHADPTGDPDANMALAQRRAEWVRDYLISAGIDQSRLDVISYGDTRLKYSRTDRRNRRVEIVAKPDVE